MALLNYIDLALQDGNPDGWFGWYKDNGSWYNKYLDESYPLTAGLYKFKEQEGLPFDIIYKELERFNKRPDLFHWALQAMFAGQNIRNTKAELKATLPQEVHHKIDWYVDLAYGEMDYNRYKEGPNYA
jgi:hypothetical protein